MDTLLLIKLVIVFGASLFLIKLLIRYAPTLGLVDIPNHRSVHQNVTPRGAGIAMMLAIILSDVLLWNEIVFTHLISFIAIFLIFAVGVLDDHRDTTPKTKFFVIIVAILLLYMDGLCIDSLGTIFGIDFDLGWFAIPYTIFAIAGLTNAMNLADGLDGLAAGMGIVILSAFAVIGFENHDPFLIYLSLSFMTAMSAFLLFNWNPAKIFMGDSGSLTLGFVIGVLWIKALPYIQPTVILFLAAIPVMDTLIVMIRRKRNGKSMFSADKFHMHHLLLGFFNGNVKKTVIFIVLLQAFYSILGYNLSNYPNQRYIIIFFLLNLAILYILLNAMISKQHPFALRKRHKKNKSFK
ncbi:MAG TPA: undecaprenyl/decaprenyl-phosphate alpha-N-acetylglucosaminyl 1-phosphate transferase [Sulfuricurvum sp.]|nr:undecaprenyl/decaprenyl-phosphate alpha-N-acetylglucosaminyl 1-phosphate transferase [Sulfuricurvum sp.]